MLILPGTDMAGCFFSDRIVVYCGTPWVVRCSMKMVSRFTESQLISPNRSRSITPERDSLFGVDDAIPHEPPLAGFIF